VSGALDSLRESLEALQTAVTEACNNVDSSGLESELEELRGALNTARSEIRDAVTAVRDAIGKVRDVATTVRELCKPDESNLIHEDRILAALDSLGGPDSSESGPLDDLGSTADGLDCAADDVTAVLGDAQEVQPAPAAGGAS
jgi:hypothetical protein